MKFEHLREYYSKFLIDLFSDSPSKCVFDNSASTLSIKLTTPDILFDNISNRTPETKKKILSFFDGVRVLDPYVNKEL